MRRPLLLLLIVATARIGTQAGGALTQVLVHLPARHQLGGLAYVEYLRASAYSTAVTRGTLTFSVLGIGGVLLVWATLVVALRVGATGVVKALLTGAAAFRLVGLSFVRPEAHVVDRLVEQLHSAEMTPAQVASLLDRYAQLETIRAVLVGATFACLLVTLATLAARLVQSPD